MQSTVKEQVDKMLSHGFGLEDLIKDLTFTQIISYIKELNIEIKSKGIALKEEMLISSIYQAKYGKLSDEEVNKYRL